jgi:hypothetical protein
MFMADLGVNDVPLRTSSMVLVSRTVHGGDDVDDVSVERGYGLVGARLRWLRDRETKNRFVGDLAPEELRIVRKRAEEKTPAREHGKDYHEALTAADWLDHYAHQLHRLHDAEYPDGWRHHSAGER